MFFPLLPRLLSGRRHLVDGPNQPTASASRLRIALVAIVAVTFGSFVTPPTVAAAGPQFIDAVDPSITADGRSAVFTAQAADGRQSVFHVDLESGDTTDLVEVLDGRRTGDTIKPVISADGCVVVVVSQIAFDVFRDNDTGERWDVYRLVLPECDGDLNDWRLVSVDDEGTATDAVVASTRPTVSASASTIAYTRTHPRWLGYTVVELVDETIPVDEPGYRTVVAGYPDAEPTLPYEYSGADEPSISSDGSTLAFTADFDAVTADGTWLEGPQPGDPATRQVFVWQRGDGTEPGSVDLVSTRHDTPSARPTSQPSLSGDGQLVAFVSADPELDPTAHWPCTDSCNPQVFVVDRSVKGVQPRVVSISQYETLNDRPLVGDGPSWGPNANEDGRQVGFLTDATNLMVVSSSGGDDSSGELMVVDPKTATLRFVETPPTTERNQTIPLQHRSFDQSASGVLTVTSTDNALDVSSARMITANNGARLAAWLAQPTLEIPDLDFGTIQAGVESTELFTVLTNEGPTAFQPERVSVDGSGFTVTGGTCTTGVIVAPGETCSIYVTAKVDQPFADATVEVVDQTGHGTTAQLRARAGLPTLFIQPGSVHLGTVTVSEKSEKLKVKISNIGFETATISKIEVIGDHASNFEVASDGCTGESLAPDETCQVKMLFAPRSGGLRTATLVATTSSGSSAAAIVGGIGEPRPTALTTSTETVARGDLIVLRGYRFAPNASVDVVLRGSDEPITVQTNSKGKFKAKIPAPANAQLGLMKIVAADGEGAHATVTVRITKSHESTALMPGYGLG